MRMTIFPLAPLDSISRCASRMSRKSKTLARHSAPRDYFAVQGARSWTVSDQLMKKEVILQGMGPLVKSKDRA
jgi:hypothetical protein